ncbi:MAG: hypothetical protein V7719_05880 [Psychroserpens sp.]|uniref:hypothetical protein n=1 Tax=Psychroserpens sp. TaxID=2020870 RepID=UPI003001833F
MKYFKIIALLFSSVIFFYACNDTTKASKQETLKPLKVLDSTTPLNVTIPNSTALEPSQNAGGVWHYTCRKGCAGGAGSAVNCDNCGGLLAHNTTYHANANSAPTSTAPYANPTAAAPAAEPSQNKAGVWHYTCGKGCVGGSGASGACSTCGGALAHNTAYHQ